MPINVCLCSPIIANRRIRQNDTYFAYMWLIYSWTFIQILISYIPFLWYLFMFFYLFFTEIFFSFQLIFNDYLYIMVIETLTSPIHDKCIFQSCRLPLVLFMTGLGSIAVLFLWANLSILFFKFMIKSANFIYQLFILFLIVSTFGRFQSFTLRVVLQIVLTLVCSLEVS